MKKQIFIIILLILSAIIIIPNIFVSAENEDEMLRDEVNNQLENFDFSDLNDLFESGDLHITDEESFKEIVKNLIDGKYKLNSSTILNKIIDVVLSNIKKIIPIILMILCISMLSNIVTSFQPNSNSKPVTDIIHFVCIAIVIVLIVSVVRNSYQITTSTIDSMCNQMNIIFPVLLSLMTTMGGVVSVGIYQPIVAILTNGVTNILSKIVYPIFILSFIFIVLNSLSKQIKLNKFISFLGSGFKWVIGFIFTLFAGLLTIQGISAGRYDTISLKATKFAVKSYIPIIGGYISDGLDYVMLSTLLIKNAIGVAGIILLISSILVPILSVVILKLGLQFVAGVVEPIADSRICDLCDNISKVLIYPVVIIIAISFMYFLSIGLIMCTVSGV